MKRFIKAVVLNNRDYADSFKRGAIVKIDLSTLSGSDEAPVVRVVGSTWGINLLSRFGLDPLAK